MKPIFFRLLGCLLMVLPTLNAGNNPFGRVDYELDWRLLDVHQDTITRAEFENRLPLFSPDESIYDYLQFDGDRAVEIATRSGPEGEHRFWKLRFRSPDDVPPPPVPIPREWQDQYLPPPPPPDLPLAGMTICLDPGHIGGEWANIEERYFRIGRHPPVKEGDLTRITMEHLARLLEASGANVVWTSRGHDPLTPLRPDNLEWSALHFMHDVRPDLFRLTGPPFLRALEWRKEFLFYRVSEVQARARRVAELQPDLTICLHYNAAPWRGRPRLFRVNKLVVFVQGSYMKEELEEEDQRYFLIRNLLANDAPKEIQMAEHIADAMQAVFDMPPENYASSGYSHQAGDHPYVWARNLIANRLFPGPTLFVEGPYMNDYDTFYRLVEGDYEGTRTIRGKEYRSIFREFAESVHTGILSYVESH